MIKNGQTLKKDGKVCERVRKNFVRLYIEKVKENFKWAKGYKDFPIYKIGSGVMITTIFITSVPEKISNHLSIQRLKYNLENCDCTDERKLLMIEEYENKRKLEQYGG